MKIATRALRVALAGGMVAGAFAVAQPSESDAAVTTIATCSNTRAIATAKSSSIWIGDGKNAGVTDIDNQDVTVSAKGVHSVGGTVGTIGGSCNFTTAQDIAGDKGLTKVAGGTLSITKWGSKTVSPEVDCVTEVSPDTTEWPLSGKLSYTFSDLSKSDAYVTTASPTGTGQDVVVLVGIVTKGRGIGSQLTSAVGYTPIIKDKLQVTDWDGTPQLTNILLALPVAGPIQGYSYDVTNATGCSDATPANANLRTIMLTSESITPLLGSAVPAGSWTIGAA